MSTTIDTKVVEMRFDNKHFESNVSSTMSTLDKLKAKLGFEGATKGLENVSNAAKNVNMNGLGNSIDTVQAKFSALQVMGVTALANITNSAVNAGKRIVSALTIQPVTTGFNEYEMKMDSIKTIVNSTGRDLEDVNKLLNELNEYSDQTIYSFKDMTQNIGKFTNAGVKLEDAVLAIKGISNEAAVSGASAQEASRAMYNFSQALSSGFVKLIDWKSIENANMATKEFKQQLIDTAVELGVVTKQGDMYTTSTGKSFNATKNFNDTLQEQWMTTDVLITTLGKYADANTDIGKKAFKAAQEVTKFTQMWDVLKETAQSGWARTWELIIGDLNSAKAILTPLTNFFSNIINAMSDFRNRILEIGLHFSKPWDAIAEKIGKITKTVENVKNTVKGAVGTLEYFQNVVTKVWRGDYNNQGDNPDRRDLLKAAGYDARVVQDLVNKGYKYKLTMEDIEASHKKFGLMMETSTEETKKVTESINELTDEQLKNAGLTEEEIRLYRALEKEAEKAGISVSELAEEMSKADGREMLVDSFKNLGNVVVGVGKAIKEAWVDIFNPPSAEELGIKLYGAIRALKEFTKSLRITDETGKLNENGLKIKRTFEGIFAAIDIVLTVVGGPLKIAFKILTQLIGAFGFNILDVTAFIGDAIVVFRDWIDSVLDFTGVFALIVDPVKNAVKNFKEWIAALKESENLPQDIAKGIATGFGKVFKAIGSFFKNLPKMFSDGFDKVGESALGGFISRLAKGFGAAGQTIVELGKILLEKLNNFLSAKGFKTISTDAIAGLVEGFQNGASEAWNAAVKMVTELVAKVKEFLGIHSPSTVFMAIGGFIIAGLISGLKNSAPDAFGAFQGVLQPIIDWLNTIDFGAILAGIIGVGTVSGVYKVTSGIGSMLGGLGEIFAGTGEILAKSARPIAKVIKNTAKVVKSFSKVLNAVALDIRLGAISNFIDSLTKCLLMLVGAIVVLTFFDKGELWNAVGILAVLAVVLVGMAFAMNKLNSASATVDKGGINIKGLSSGLTGIGMAIMMLGITAKMLGTMKPEQLEQGMWSLVGIIAAVGALLIAFMKIPFGPSDAVIVTNLGKTMKQIGIALVLMAVVVKLLGGMNSSELIQGTIAITAFAGIMVGLMAATKLISGSKNVGSIGGTLLKIAAAIGLMALTVKTLGKMDQAELIQGGIAITAFAGIMVGLMAATKLITGSKNVDKIGGTLLKIGVAIGIMGLVVKLLGNMKPGEIIQGTLAIAAFGGMIVGLMAATKLISGSKNIGKIGGAILAVSGAIAIMAFTALMLSMISWEGFAKGTIMITAFAGIVVGLMAATRLIGPDADKIGKTIIMVAGAIGVLALIAVILGLVPVENLKQGVIAVSILSILMAGLIAVTSLVKKDTLGPLIVLASMMLVLGGILITLSCLKPESVMSSAIALGGLLVVLSEVLFILTTLGPLGTEALKSIGVLAALTGVLALIGLVLAMMTALGVQEALPNAAALSILLISMSVVCAIMSMIPIPAAVSGALGLAAFIGIMAGVLLILGGLSKIPGFNELIADGGETLSLIGKALGAFVGSIVAGFAGEVLTILPALGLALSGFMTGATPFITGAKMVDESVLTGVGILAGAVLALTAADLIAGVVSFLQGGSSFADLGTQLSQFMMNAMPFITAASMITPETMAGVKALAETILIITAANVLEGITSFITGGSSLETFAAQLPILGQGLAAFSASLGTFSEEQLATVSSAANAVKMLASAAAEIPNTGGLLASLVGENDLSTFASQFPVLGTGLALFLANVGTFTDEQVATVDCAAKAIKSLAQASSEIPNSGGWVGAIVGENDLGTFASQFPKLGTGLSGFLTNVGTFSEDQIATVDCAAKAIKTLASASSEIPNSGGWVGAIVGENDLGTFASQFPKLGTGLAGFVKNIGTFSEDKVMTVNTAVKAVKALAKLADADLKGATKHLSDFGDDLPNFGEDLGEFCSSMPSTESTSAAVSNLKKILSAVESIASTNSGPLATFADNLKKIGKDAVKKFVEAFTSNSTKTDLKKAAKDLGDQVVDGIESKEKTIKTAGEKAAKKAVSGVKTQKDEMKSAGKDLGSGLVKGIDAKQTAVYNAGFRLGQKAVEGEKDGQKSNSPSKLTIQAGKWLGEGLVIGIGKMGNRVYNAGSTLGETATDSLSSSISRISDMISSDIDSQPTIRPVLDLSDVRSGASTISSMLGLNSSVGVRANVGAISASMATRQNGRDSSDVVAAIKALRKDISDMPRNNYNINGITYDDGSNINDAVETLVRAARIERRT